MDTPASDSRIELQALHATLHDAMKDTQLWAAYDPSNEERLYVREMQRVIWLWLAWVGRRLCDLSPADEDQQAYEFPKQFLCFYKSASEVRGRPVGEHLARLAERLEAAERPVTKQPSPPSWEHIEITFLSDERVQVVAGTTRQTLNYAEFGFEDGRNHVQNRAWATLQLLAQERGVIRKSAGLDRNWSMVEKRMQEIRAVFRTHFGLDSDPLPFIPGTGYKALFKIRTSPSIDT